MAIRGQRGTRKLSLVSGGGSFDFFLGRFQSNPLEYEAKPLSSFRRNGIQIERCEPVN